jgi:LEA14-like dessication related protein
MNVSKKRSSLRRAAAIIVMVLCVFACKETPPPKAKPAIPRIAEPKFSITAITILQDNLVNTRLKVTLRIENPNAFPVALSSFEYELYGEGQFWADGAEKNVVSVEALSRTEKDLLLVMNFIDMKRDLLDKVIAMELVNYRFTGTVAINAANMPLLLKNFDLEGESEVSR